MRTESQIRILIKREFRWIVALLVLVVVLLLIRLFAIESYYVSSPSMEPALRGRPQGGDHVFVNKLSSRLGSARRWDIALFRRAGERLSFIKRVVGLPGESIEIVRGECVIDGRRLEKTLDQQDRLLVPVFESGDGGETRYRSFFRVKGESVRFHQSEAILGPGADPEGVALATQTEVRDGVLAPDGRYLDGVHPVGELVVWAEVRPGTEPGALELEIRNGDESSRAHLTWAAPGKAPPAGSFLEAGDRRRELDHQVLVTGRSSRLRFGNVDGKVTLRIGDRVFPTEALLAGTSSGFDPGSLRNQVTIRVRGGQLVIERLRVCRDLYYTNRGRHGVGRAYSIPPDHYFLLGDNSRVSDDCRLFGAVSSKGLVGKAFLIHWPLSRVRGL